MLFFKCFLFLALSLYSLFVFADSGMIEVMPISMSAGHTAKFGPEPYFRWTTKIQLAGGEWESRTFVISSDALFQLLEAENVQLLRQSERIFQVGAMEALWKGGHVGIGFEGVTWGADVDQQYSQLFRTGVYAILNILRNEAIRLDIRSGYEFESKHINLSEAQSVITLPQELVMRWRTRFLSGKAYTRIGFNPAEKLGFDTLRTASGVQSHVRVLSIKDLRIGMGLDLKTEHDPVREKSGLYPDSATASIYLDLSYIRPFNGRDYGMRILK